MGFLDAVRRLFGKTDVDDDMPHSIALLLRSPLALTEDVLSAAASRAFGVPYDGSDPMHFVVCKSLLTVVKAGSYAITVLSGDGPYLGDPVETAKGFRDKRMADAWCEHREWVAFDLQNRDVPKKEAYRVLAALAFELLDVRSAGVWLPKESEFTIQSDGSAATVLERLKRA